MSKTARTEIDETINRWFEEAVDRMNAQQKNNDPEYDLCCGVLPLAHNYCVAVLLLLNNKKKLPAMALLRVLGELALKLLWCLFEDNPRKETAEIRIERWLKESYRQRQNYLKKLLLVVGVDEKKKIERELEYVKNQMGDILRPLPGQAGQGRGSFYRSLDELVVETESTNEVHLNFKDQLYRLLYGRFNQAIHPDLLTLSKLMKQDGNVRCYSGDFDDIDSEGLKIPCMTCAFNIIACIRISYGWDYQDMKDEYLQARKRSGSKK